MPGQQPAAALPPPGPFTQMAQQMAGQGVGGDNMTAHLTSGEIVIPPEVQTPKVLAIINQAFKQKGVSPAQFTAGSPQASQNPSTGAQQFNFLSAFLPIALSMAGNAIAPGVGSALGAAGMPLGAGMSSMLPYLLGAGGAALGSKLSGGTGQQALMAGLGAGVGGWGAGKLFGGGAAGATGGAPAQASGAAAGPVSAGMSATSPQAGSVMYPQGFGPAASQPSALMQNLPQTIGMGLGAAGGHMMGAPIPPVNGLPANFHNPMTPQNQLPSASQYLGMPMPATRPYLPPLYQ